MCKISWVYRRMDAVEASGLLAQGQMVPWRRPLLSNTAWNESHDVSDPVTTNISHHWLVHTRWLPGSEDSIVHSVIWLSRLTTLNLNVQCPCSSLLWQRHFNLFIFKLHYITSPSSSSLSRWVEWLTWVCAISNKQHSEWWQVDFLVVLLSQQTPVHVTRLYHRYRRYTHIIIIIIIITSSSCSSSYYYLNSRLKNTQKWSKKLQVL